MPNCTICGEAIPPGSRTWSICGSRVDEPLPTGTWVTSPATPAAPLPRDLPPEARYCPVCAKIYAADYPDSFCTCGTELVTDLPAAAILDEPPLAPVLDDDATPA